MKPLDLEDENRFSPCRKNAFAFFSLSLLILIVYSNTLDASWHLDDGPNIVENRGIHLAALTWPEIKKTLFSTPPSSRIEFFRPVSRLSFAMNYYLGRLDIFGYHVVNVFIHITAALFLFLFLHHALRLSRPAAKYAPYSYFVALLATTFWAIHPIQTQAVTYVVQRMASMAGMFYIMSMYFYVKARIATRRGTRAVFLGSCVAAGLLSLGSKENAVLLPASLFLFHLFVEKEFTTESLKKNLKVFTFTYVIPLLGGLVVVLLFTDMVEKVFQLYETRPFTLWERFLTQPRVLVLYITLLLYPIPGRLSIDHDILISRSLLDPPTTALAFLLIFAILFAACALARKEPLVPLSVLFFFLNHSLESTILPMELVFEHRNYLPSMLFFVPVVIGLLKILSYLSYRPALQNLLALFIVLLLMSFGQMTFSRNFAWKDEGSLWLDCLQKYPGSVRGHHNLGRYFSLRGQESIAVNLYTQALRGREIHSKKEKGISHFNLGLIAHARGEYDHARHSYLKALELDPCCPGAHNNLADLLLVRHEKDISEILRILRRAVECGHSQELPLALSNMGMLLLKTERPAEALEALNKAAETDPNNPLTLLRLGYAYLQTGHLGKASIYLKRSITLDPGNTTGRLCLAEAHIRSGHVDEGRAILKHLLEAVSPEDLVAHLLARVTEKALMDVTPDVEYLLPFLVESLRTASSAFQGALDMFLQLQQAIKGPSTRNADEEKERGRAFALPLQ